MKKLLFKKYIRLSILTAVLIGVVVYGAYFFNLLTNNYNYPEPSELPQEYTFALSADNENLILHLETAQIYSRGCVIQIYADKKIESNYVEISIRDVNTNPPNVEICTEDLLESIVEPYHAKTSINLENPRTMQLIFSLGPKKDTYQIKVEDGIISVDPQGGSFTTYIEKEDF